MNNQINRINRDHRQSYDSCGGQNRPAATDRSPDRSRRFSASARRGSSKPTSLSAAPAALSIPLGARRDETGPPYWRAITLTFLTLALTVAALNANAQITEDCILEGRVDMRKAEQIGQPMYVRFDKAYRGSEGTCSLNRSSSRRRVKFISNPNLDELDDVTHGARIRYRYVERDGQPGSWELIEVSDRR